MNDDQDSSRYKTEDGKIVIEVAIKNSRQLFNERDPAPFRERDLDHQFVTHIVTAVEEFPLRTKMKIRIISADLDDVKSATVQVIGEAIHTYFRYESTLAKSKLRSRLRTARYFFLIGTLTLFVCLSLAELMSSAKSVTHISNIASVGLVIIGWVAMWQPVEALLYGWWPIREQRRYFDKIAALSVEVVSDTLVKV